MSHVHACTWLWPLGFLSCWRLSLHTWRVVFWVGWCCPLQLLGQLAPTLITCHEDFHGKVFYSYHALAYNLPHFVGLLCPWGHNVHAAIFVKGNKRYCLMWFCEIWNICLIIRRKSGTNNKKNLETVRDRAQMIDALQDMIAILHRQIKQLHLKQIKDTCHFLLITSCIYYWIISGCRKNCELKLRMLWLSVFTKTLRYVIEATLFEPSYFPLMAKIMLISWLLDYCHIHRKYVQK